MGVLPAGVQFDFQRSHVLVTGGARGIGAGIAQAYLDAGADVTITGRAARAEDYDEALPDCRYLSLETRDDARLQAVCDAMSAVDILVNNAGGAFPDGRDESDPDVFEQSLRMNLVSAYRLAVCLRDKLAASALGGGASVIGIASMTSFFGNPVVPAYGAGKAALVQLCKTLAMAWAPQRIRVNAVAAGLVRSNMTAPMLDADDQSATNAFLSRTPLGRVGESADIAAAALFLSSPAAAYITGTTLVVDGGYSVAG